MLNTVAVPPMPDDDGEPEKPPMPDQLRALAQQAASRHRKRSAIPEIVTRDEQMGHFQHLTCPYRREDWELWLALLTECFGTRVYEVAQSFMRQLAALVPHVLYEGEKGPRADEEAMHQALAIVFAVKPRNEAEAAHAAQLVAVHLATMRVGAAVGRAGGYLDPRTAGSLALLTRTFGTGLETLDKLKRGERKPARQIIKVQKTTNVQINDNRAVTVPGGGCDNRSSQAGGAEEIRARARDARPDERPALPSPAEERESLSGGCGEGQDGLQITRGREGIGRA